MSRLRHACPWDAQQTHRSLVQYLIEETAETVEAIESGDHAHLREELGDLLLQVVFHAEIAAEGEPGFELEDVARGIADKLVARHPYVFATAEVPSDLHYTWEQRKAVEKGRTSVLQGIPEQLSALARASKIIGRARSRRVDIELPADLVSADQVGPSCSGWWPGPMPRASTRTRHCATRYVNSSSGYARPRRPPADRGFRATASEAGAGWRDFGAESLA